MPEERYINGVFLHLKNKVLKENGGMGFYVRFKCMTVDCTMEM